MIGGWLARGLLAFLLTFAVAGLAHGQTKSADLPVPQRFDCAPSLPPIDSLSNDLPVWFSPETSSFVPELKACLFGLRTDSLPNPIPTEGGLFPCGFIGLHEGVGFIF